MGEGPLHPTYRTPTKELRAAHIAQGGLKRAQTSRGELRTAQESSGQPMAAQGGRKRAQTSGGNALSLHIASSGLAMRYRRFEIDVIGRIEVLCIAHLSGGGVKFKGGVGQCASEEK